ncbi:MAG: DUF2070 family protein [Nitrososphaerota archaeon]
MNGEVAGSIASHYRLIRGVATTQRSAIALMFILSAVSAALLSYTLPASSPTFLILAAPLLYILYNYLISHIYPNRYGTFTFRRLNSLAALEVLIVSAGVAASSAVLGLGFRDQASAVFAAFLSTAIYVSYSVRRGIGGGFLGSILSMLHTPAIGSAIIYIQTGHVLKSFLNTAVSTAVPIALMEMVRAVLDHRLSFDGVKLFRLCQSFFGTLLSGRGEELEKMLVPLSREATVRNDLFLIKREEGKPIAVVVTDVHPGPFRDVGSSAYPSILMRRLAAKGFEPMVLKGLSSHEKNLVTRRDAEELAEIVSRRAGEMMSLQPYSACFSTPRRLVLNGAKALWWVMGGKTLCLLTLHPNPMEDLPAELADGQDDVLPVDTHNSFDASYKALDRESVSKLKSLINHLRENGKASGEYVRIGYSRVVPGGIGLAEGMGPGGISCLVVAARSGKAAVFAADANNAAPWVREMVREVAERYGMDDAELCTTDTHAVNAVNLGGQGYRPLGATTRREELEKLVDRLLSEALSSLSPATAAHTTIKTRVRVFSDFLEPLSPRVSAGAKIYLAAMAASAWIPLLTALL